MKSAHPEYLRSTCRSTGVHHRGRIGTRPAAVILVHGRGASAQDMLPLVDPLTAPGFIYLMPEASGHLWYPNRYDSPLDFK